MGFKLLAFLVVINLALSIADPLPDDVMVDVSQFVNARGAGCCTDCCPGPDCCEPEPEPEPCCCEYDGKFWPAGTKIPVDCADCTCQGGIWVLIGENNCIGEPCGCMFVDDGEEGTRGCMLSEPKLPGRGCNCTLAYDGFTPFCYGTINACTNPESYFCRTTGSNKGHCLQGGGNCAGY